MIIIMIIIIIIIVRTCHAPIIINEESLVNIKYYILL